MPITRAAFDREMLRLVGRPMALVGLDGVTEDGTNPDLNAALRDALRDMGYAVADPLTVADVDLIPLAPAALQRLTEHVELRVRERVDEDFWRAEQAREPGLEARVVGGAVDDPLRRIASRNVARVEKLREAVRVPYQTLNAPLVAGALEARPRPILRFPCYPRLHDEWGCD